MKISIFPGKINQGTAFYNVAHSLYESLYINGFENIQLLILNGSDKIKNHKIVGKFNYITLFSRRSLTCTPELILFLFKHKPDVLISMPSYINIVTLIAVCIARLTGWKGKLIITEHAVMSQKSIEHKNEIVMGNMPLYSRLLYRYSNAVVCVSNGVAKDLKDNIKINKTSIYTIHNSIDINEVITKSNLQTKIHPWLQHNKNIPCFISVGRLAIQKNYPFLLKALSIVNNYKKVRLLIIGEGSERDKLYKLIDYYNLINNVELLGFIKNPYPYIKASSGLLMSSHEEAFGLVIVEALTLKTPVISTDAIGGGPREIISSTKSGILVNRTDYNAFSQAIITFSNYRKNIDSNKIIDPFSTRNIGRKWKTLINSLTDE